MLLASIPHPSTLSGMMGDPLHLVGAAMFKQWLLIWITTAIVGFLPVWFPLNVLFQAMFGRRIATTAEMSIDQARHSNNASKDHNDRVTIAATILYLSGTAWFAWVGAKGQSKPPTP